MNLIHSSRVTSQFTDKVRYISDLLNIDPNWLMWVMYFESTLNHRAVNKTSGATGLIQFMPSTARGLGTTTASLLQMTAVEQLDYVYAYLKPYKNRMNAMVDVYLAVFFPLAMNKPPEYVLQTSTLSASKIASQNAGLDLNKNGQITRTEVEAKVSVGLPSEYQAIMKKKTQ
ncbi:MAG: transglycosylase SLT domain-containing protein [Bacteroidota bacterium]|nr:transglycosylase SLT domain-containing protein [Bacteroidota bacterium]